MDNLPNSNKKGPRIGQLRNPISGEWVEEGQFFCRVGSDLHQNIPDSFDPQTLRPFDDDLEFGEVTVELF